MAYTKTSGQTTPRTPSLGKATRKGSAGPNVAKGRGTRVSSGKNSGMGGVKTGTTYGNHNVAHPC